MKLRQIMISTVVMLFLGITLQTIFNSHRPAIKVYLLLNIYIDLTTSLRLLKERPSNAPVSYTHLDVYKRQL